jgi:acetyltransferase-like isoleucine patch superfamily enzyme
MIPEVTEVGINPSTCGTNVKIISPSNIYGAHLGDDVFVGPFCEIQKGVIVGDRTRIQSHSFLCEKLTIGTDCFIGHGVMFINDLLRNGPARGDTSKWLPTSLGDRVSIGSNSTILPIEICSDVVIGAGSVVTVSITQPGTYVGNPARRVRG